MNRRQTGTAYEELAARRLSDQGYEILERNFYCRQGEIDLIARDGGYLVFIEVKYRRDLQSGHPLEAVGTYKQRRIARAAVYYCHSHGISDSQACRFDVISILGNEIEHVKNAFELI
ncbi:MAG: YraN family protein [Lachnospiraceae bacterium]|nr:YraN family protein [Lachnospiraceae bacterium]